MVQIIKSEWHQVEKRYSYEFDEVLLAEIYPDDSEEEIQNKLELLESGDLDIDLIIQDAQDISIDWEWLDEDDWYTDRKGGYDVTYEVSNVEE